MRGDMDALVNKCRICRDINIFASGSVTGEQSSITHHRE